MLLLLLFICPVTSVSAFDLTLHNASARVYFSPKECTTTISSEIDAAKSEILMQADSFTSAPIAKALANAAYGRSVEVRVVLDKSQHKEKQTAVNILAKYRLLIFIDAAHAIAPNMIIDRETVIIGSLDCTQNNMLIIKNPELADIYFRNSLGGKLDRCGRSGDPSDIRDRLWICAIDPGSRSLHCQRFGVEWPIGVLRISDRLEKTLSSPDLDDPCVLTWMKLDLEASIFVDF